MRWKILLLPLLGVLIFYGCKDGGVQPVQPPSNFAIEVAGNDSLSLKLSWTASPTTDIDGYVILFNGNPIDTTTETTVTLTPTSLGVYKVYAYRGSDVSDYSNTVSTKLIEASDQGPVYIVPSAAGPSGYGWNAKGSGSTYSLGTMGNRQNVDKVDFVFDRDTTLTDPKTFDSAFQHKTGIAYNETWTYDELDKAPTTGYMDNQRVTYPASSTYVLWIHNKYYVKMTVTFTGAGADSYIKFKYGFQPIAGFRRLK